MENKHDLTAMIQKIVQDPSFAGMVSELREDSSSASSGEISSEMMEKLPDVLSMLSPMLGSQDDAPQEKEENKKEEHGETRENTVQEKRKGMRIEQILPKKYDKNKAEKLLHALKPYLSPSRCAIIDQCMSVMQLTDVMQALQGLEGLTKNSENGGA